LNLGWGGGSLRKVHEFFPHLTLEAGANFPPQKQRLHLGFAAPAFKLQ
jgi:hypothetical protein